MKLAAMTAACAAGSVSGAGAHRSGISAPAEPDDAAQERAIARAVWTDLLWLMPTGRTVTVTVRDGRVAVALGPREAAAEAQAH